MSDWADEIAKELYLGEDWTDIAAALRKARQDALSEALDAVDGLMPLRRENTYTEGVADGISKSLDTISALKEKQL
jgi:quinol monooxygenase YgiN